MKQTGVDERMKRRRFLKLTGAGMLGLLSPGMLLGGCSQDSRNHPEDVSAKDLTAVDPWDELWCVEPDTHHERPNHFHFLVMADTHIIDDFYVGPEGNPRDTESIFKTRDRLNLARSSVESLPVDLDLGIVAGDVVHNYPFEDRESYRVQETRFDIASRLLRKFSFPMVPLWGNHDYSIPRISPEFTHELLMDKFGTPPYYSIAHKGCQFLFLNNMLGATMNPEGAHYNKDIGSFGLEQLEWFEARLQWGIPSFVFLHFPLAICAGTERHDFGLYDLLRRYRDTIRLVVSGHTHQWMNFSDLYGPTHLVCGSTRYDEDCFMVIRVDLPDGHWRILNWNSFGWGTNYARPALW